MTIALFLFRLNLKTNKSKTHINNFKNKFHKHIVFDILMNKN